MKKANHKVAAVVSLVVFFVVMALFWLSGYNFDHRSSEVAVGGVVALLATAVGYLAVCGITADI